MKKKKTPKTPSTTFDVKKQQVVAYPLGKSKKDTHITFELRHIFGHLLVEALTKRSIDPNKHYNKKGKKSRKLQNAIKAFVASFKNEPVKKMKPRRKKLRKTS